MVRCGVPLLRCQIGIENFGPEAAFGEGFTDDRGSDLVPVKQRIVMASARALSPSPRHLCPTSCLLLQAETLLSRGGFREIAGGGHMCPLGCMSGNDVPVERVGFLPMALVAKRSADEVRIEKWGEIYTWQ